MLNYINLDVYFILQTYLRYCLYARWKNEAGERIPALIRVRGNSLQKIKHIMKRVSKENIKPQGRLIGKLSHAAPAFLFDYVLLQVIGIQSIKQFYFFL